MNRATPGPRRYLSLLERAAAAVEIPVIASLNGVTPDGWTEYARAMQDAGAAAIELNIYYLPSDPQHLGSRRRAAPPRRAVARQGGGVGAGRGEAQPVLQLDSGERWPCDWTRPALTGSSCSIGSCSLTSTSRR
jgi:hypothetical protein